MQKTLEGVQGGLHLVHRRRDVDSVLQRATRRADPVLAAPKLARRLVLTAHAFHQTGMDFADQAQAQRQRLQPLQAILERLDEL